MQSGDAMTQPRRQNLLKLQQSADRGFFDSAHAALRRSAQPQRYGDSFVIIEEKRRECSAGTELISAFDAGRRVHRIAQAAQTIHIAPQSSSCYFETARQFRAGPIPLRLK